MPSCDGRRIRLQRRLLRADAGLDVLLRDISDIRASQDILMKTAHLDALTGLPNRLWLTHFLLRAIGAAAAVRAKDRLARLGGDGFVIALAKADHAEIVRIARRIIATLAEDFLLNDHQCCRTRASIGISRYPQDGRCAACLLRNADMAMYAAMRSGKGRHAFHAASPAAPAPSRAWSGPASASLRAVPGAGRD